MMDLKGIFRLDGWQNLFTGLGTSRDKRVQSIYVASQVDDTTLEMFYHGDDMAARVVDTVPDEALRKGYDIKIIDDDNPDEASKTSEDIKAALADLDVNDVFLEAYAWSRLYGGAAILIGADDGASTEQMNQPLNEDRISKITHLTVIDRRSLIAEKIYEDPLAPKYGQPETYRIVNDTIAKSEQSTDIVIHESRCVVFDGVRVSKTRRAQNGGWGDSVLQRVNDVLRDFNVGWDSVAHLLTDAAQSVYKMKGLISQIAAGNSSALVNRMTLVDMNRSVSRAIMMDADGESFERQAYNFTGIDSILQMFVLRLSAAARMPATILMGQSPAGENATGEADFQWFYSTVSTAQTNYLKPKLKRLIELLLRSKDGPTAGLVPDDWNVVFEPLWELNPLQQADMRLKVAQQDKIYADLGVLLTEEITLSRFRADGWSAETDVDLEIRREMLDLEKEKELENIKNPPEPPPVPPVLPLEPPPVPPKSEDESE